MPSKDQADRREKIGTGVIILTCIFTALYFWVFLFFICHMVTLPKAESAGVYFFLFGSVLAVIPAWMLTRLLGGCSKSKE